MKRPYNVYSVTFIQGLISYLLSIIYNYVASRHCNTY